MTGTMVQVDLELVSEERSALRVTDLLPFSANLSGSPPSSDAQRCVEQDDDDEGERLGESEQPDSSGEREGASKPVSERKDSSGEPGGEAMARGSSSRAVWAGVSRLISSAKACR